MSADYHVERLNTIRQISPDWLVYTSPKSLFYDLRDFTKIPKGSCIGVKLADEVILFKHIGILRESPRKLKKAFHKCQELNQTDPTYEEAPDLDYFLPEDSPAVETLTDTDIELTIGLKE